MAASQLDRAMAKATVVLVTELHRAMVDMDSQRRGVMISHRLEDTASHLRPPPSLLTTATDSLQTLGMELTSHRHTASRVPTAPEAEVEAATGDKTTVMGRVVGGAGMAETMTSPRGAIEVAAGVEVAAMEVTAEVAMQVIAAATGAEEDTTGGKEVALRLVWEVVTEVATKISVGLEIMDPEMSQRLVVQRNRTTLTTTPFLFRDSVKA